MSFLDGKRIAAADVQQFCQFPAGSSGGLTPAEALELTVESFRFMAGFEGAVPGASEVECGNYRDMDLPAAKAEAAAMLPVLEALTGDELHY